MLRTIRDNLRGTAAKIVLGIIIVPFVFFGVESIFGGGSVPVVMEVNGQEIDRAMVGMEVNLLRGEILQQMGDTPDFSQLDDERLQEPALERLKLRALLGQTFNALEISAPAALVDNTIRAEPSLAVDGKFSPQRLEMLLADRGMSVQLLKQRIAEQIAQSHFRMGVGLSNFVLPQDYELLLNIVNEVRTASWIEIGGATLAASVAVSDDDRRAYYDENASRFLSQRTLVLDYIELKLTDFYEPVEEALLREEYQRFANNYDVVERRRLAHILLPDYDPASSEPGSMPDILARLAAGEAFKDLARQYSSDSGSAASGGDLGLNEQDGTYPAAFEQAAFTLSLNEHSAPVQTDAGWHVIKVTAIERDEIPTYAEQKDMLTAQLQKTAAEPEYLAKLDALADLVFNADGLDGPAKQLDLELLRSEPLTRTGNSGVFADSRVLDIAFSEDVLNERLNSDVIEMNEGHSIVLRVHEVHEPRQLSMQEVFAQVDAAVRQQKTTERLRAEVEELASLVVAGELPAAVALERGYDSTLALQVTRRSTNVDSQLLREIFAAPRSRAGTGSVAELVLDDRAYVFLLDGVETGDDSASEEDRNAVIQSLQSAFGEQDYRSYIKQLENRAEIVNF